MLLHPEEALARYRETPRGRYLMEHGQLLTRIGHHKNNEFEFGGHRYVVSACHSDRPAFIITFKSGELGDVELLHFYCAQGLSKQKADQQALLARVADFGLALAVVEAARDLLHIQRINTRAIAKDPEMRERQLQVWQSQCGSPDVWPSRAMRIHDSTCPLYFPRGDVGFTDTTEFLRRLDPENTEWLDLIGDVQQILAGARRSTRLPTVEEAPIVHYRHENRNCQTPPAQAAMVGV